MSQLKYSVVPSKIKIKGDFPLPFTIPSPQARLRACLRKITKVTRGMSHNKKWKLLSTTSKAARLLSRRGQSALNRFIADVLTLPSQRGLNTTTTASVLGTAAAPVKKPEVQKKPRLPIIVVTSPTGFQMPVDMMPPLREMKATGKIIKMRQKWQRRKHLSPLWTKRRFQRSIRI